MTDIPIRAPDDLSPELITSLRLLCENAPGPCDDWLVIGSTAGLLSGADLEPADVDVTASSYTIRAFLQAFGASETNRIGHPLFRSRIFQKVPIHSGLPIEFMGDMSLVRENPRVPMPLHSRVEVVGSFGRVYVPNLTEQISMMRRFGRAKDLARIPQLQAALDRRAP